MSPLLPGIVASGISGHLFTPEGSAYEIASYTVPTGGISNVTLAVPSGYRHIRIEALVNSTSGGEDNQIMRFNGDTASNYVWHFMYGNGANMYASNSGGATTSIPYPSVPGTTGDFTASVIDILDHASTAKNKTIRISGGFDNNGSGRISKTSGLWMNTTTPITSVSFNTGALISANSTFTLIGYK